MAHIVLSETLHLRVAVVELDRPGAYRIIEKY